eukprot:TRINITY_DN9726_c0_g1_i2.p1 TRINITY_DN9726_c0_g1~~TRINITY_DN9726_c0_g1_i2.p1  ORF type:complete len:232 (+),score=28.87 TRINITY_DN9726_c0_g1_i2:577-1272(+)
MEPAQQLVGVAKRPRHKTKLDMLQRAEVAAARRFARRLDLKHRTPAEGSILDWIPMPELQLQILSWVDLRDLGRLSCVCRTLRLLASEDLLWRPLFERKFGWHHEKMKSAALPWKEQYRRVVTPPTHVEFKSIGREDLVMCSAQIGDFFFGRNGQDGVAKYAVPVCRTSEAIKKQQLVDTGSIVWPLGNYIGLTYGQNEVILLDSDLDVAGRIAVALPWKLVAFGDNFVRL